MGGEYPKEADPKLRLRCRENSGFKIASSSVSSCFGNRWFLIKDGVGRGRRKELKDFSCISVFLVINNAKVIKNPLPVGSGTAFLYVSLGCILNLSDSPEQALAKARGDGGQGRKSWTRISKLLYP